MPVKLKTQNDYLLTEVSIDLPPDREIQNRVLSEIDTLMRASHGSGKVVAQYCEGGLLGINIEQKSKVRSPVVDRVREIVGVVSKEINGHHK